MSRYEGVASKDWDVKTELLTGRYNVDVETGAVTSASSTDDYGHLGILNTNKTNKETEKMSANKTNDDRVFEYAIIQYPTEEEAEKGARAEFISLPAPVIARDKDEVKMLVSKTDLENVKDEGLDRVEILVRPFG
jgi:hypothetical protein